MSTVDITQPEAEVVSLESPSGGTGVSLGGTPVTVNTNVVAGPRGPQGPAGQPGAPGADGTGAEDMPIDPVLLFENALL